MSEGYSISYTGLLADGERGAFANGLLAPQQRMNPARCEMPSGIPNSNVAIAETIAIAAGGGWIGTELPPDQVP